MSTSEWPHEPLADHLRATAASACPGRTAELVADVVTARVHARPSRLTPATPAERAVVEVAEQFVVDVHGLDDATVARLAALLPPAEAVAVMVHLALCDGFAKRDLAASALRGSG